MVDRGHVGARGARGWGIMKFFRGKKESLYVFFELLFF